MGWDVGWGVVGDVRRGATSFLGHLTQLLSFLCDIGEAGSLAGLEVQVDGDAWIDKQA